MVGIHANSYENLDYAVFSFIENLHNDLHYYTICVWAQKASCSPLKSAWKLGWQLMSQQVLLLSSIPYNSKGILEMPPNSNKRCIEQTRFTTEVAGLTIFTLCHAMVSTFLQKPDGVVMAKPTFTMLLAVFITISFT